jgi:hypothetical protein
MINRIHRPHSRRKLLLKRNRTKFTSLMTRKKLKKMRMNGLKAPVIFIPFLRRISNINAVSCSIELSSEMSKILNRVLLSLKLLSSKMLGSKKGKVKEKGKVEFFSINSEFLCFQSCQKISRSTFSVSYKIHQSSRYCDHKHRCKTVWMIRLHQTSNRNQQEMYKIWCKEPVSAAPRNS